MRARALWTVCAALALVAGCSSPERETAPGGAPAAAPPASRPAGAEAGTPLVVLLGDSLTAGFGVDGDEAYPALLEELLAAAGAPARLVNAGVSGDTTAGGLARLEWLLAQRPDVVVVELGANDGLRGLRPAETEANLRSILAAVRRAGATPLLVGMRLPPNYGPDYVERFEAIFPRLAAELEVPLMPFLLAGVYGRPDLNLADGIHPNAEGHRRIADAVLPHLLPLVRQAAAR